MLECYPIEICIMDDQLQKHVPEVISKEEIVLLDDFLKSVGSSVNYVHGYLTGTASVPNFLESNNHLAFNECFRELDKNKDMFALTLKMAARNWHELLHYEFDPLLWDGKSKLSNIEAPLSLLREWSAGYQDALDNFLAEKVCDEFLYYFPDQVNKDFGPNALYPTFVLSGRVDPKMGDKQYMSHVNKMVNGEVDELRHLFVVMVQDFFDRVNSLPSANDHSEFDGYTGANKKSKNVIPMQSKKVGRNEPCQCGSGKKYKKCCLNQAETVS